MKIQRIKRQATNFFSEKDLLLSESQHELSDFIGIPFSKDAFQKQVLIKSKEFSTEKRELLVKVLQKNYAAIDGNEACLKNISALTNENCFTITTGHQLSLLTGPIYFIYKILHVIKQCDELKVSYPDLQFVPVYWMASEDHDFEEIKSFMLFGKEIKWNTEQSGAVGRMTLNGLQEVKNKIAAVFQNNDSSEAKEWIDKLNGETYGEAFFKLIHHLFGKYGLLILDADNSNLKKAFSPILKEELTSFFSMEEVLKTNKRLLARNIKPKVNTREINLFFLSKNKRERIIHENNKYKIGSQHFSKEEVLQMLEQMPESFSPNVILRPLYQEFTLPNLNYVGGLGELNYWLQLKSSFERVNLTFPLIQVRSSLIWIDSSTKNKMNSVGLSEAAIFRTTNELTKSFISQNEKDTIDFSEINEHASNLKKEILTKSLAIDQALNPFIEAEITRIEKQLEAIQSKLEKSVKLKHEKALKTIVQIKEKLFPNNNLQERSLNFLQICKNGEIYSFIETIFQTIDPFNSDVLILTEEHEAK
jgi:bacillithiol biosynthesis cysteine-adding enzyme BshC